MSLSMGYFLVEKEQVTPEELFQQVSMEKNVLKRLTTYLGVMTD